MGHPPFPNGSWFPPRHISKKLDPIKARKDREVRGWWSCYDSNFQVQYWMKRRRRESLQEQAQG